MNIYEKVIDVMGEDNQIIQLFEEMFELGFAVCKWRRHKHLAERYPAYVEDVTTEIADVLIMIEQIKLIIGIENSDIADETEKKLRRLKETLTTYGRYE